MTKGHKTPTVHSHSHARLADTLNNPVRLNKTEDPAQDKFSKLFVRLVVRDLF